MPKTPEQIAREAIDRRLNDAGWVIQDMNKINLSAALGVAIHEFPTSTGPVDYALFVAGKPVGVVEAKKDTEAQNITVVEGQSFRYANSTFKYLDEGYEIRFAYEATGTLTRFTDFHDIKYRSRSVFSFHQPETLQDWIAAPDTVRNNLKHLPELDTTGFRKCQEIAIKNLDTSFAENRPKALVDGHRRGKDFYCDHRILPPAHLWEDEQDSFSRGHKIPRSTGRAGIPGLCTEWRIARLLGYLRRSTPEEIRHVSFQSGLYQHDSENVFYPEGRGTV